MSARLLFRRRKSKALEWEADGWRIRRLWVATKGNQEFVDADRHELCEQVAAFTGQEVQFEKRPNVFEKFCSDFGIKPWRKS